MSGLGPKKTKKEQIPGFINECFDNNKNKWEFTYIFSQTGTKCQLLELPCAHTGLSLWDIITFSEKFTLNRKRRLSERQVDKHTHTHRPRFQRSAFKVSAILNKSSPTVWSWKNIKSTLEPKTLNLF